MYAELNLTVKYVVPENHCPLYISHCPVIPRKMV
jgi:hypothetical protein